MMRNLSLLKRIKSSNSVNKDPTTCPTLVTHKHTILNKAVETVMTKRLQMITF